MSLDQTLGLELIRKRSNAAAGDHESARQLIHAQTLIKPIELGHQVKARQAGGEPLPQPQPKMAFDEIRAGQEPQPEAQRQMVIVGERTFPIVGTRIEAGGRSVCGGGGGGHNFSLGLNDSGLKYRAHRIAWNRDTGHDKADSLAAMKASDGNLRRPALFLDRDGVINIDHGYVHRAEAFDFVPGIFELVRAANVSGYRVVVVTNQSGIARGFFSESQFHDLTGWMRDRFSAEGCWIDAVYFCPFHPEHGLGIYRRESHYRKPGPGMLLQAARDWSLDLASSILVGDNVTDMRAGRAAGIRRRFLLGSPHPSPDWIPIAQIGDVLPHVLGPSERK